MSNTLDPSFVSVLMPAFNHAPLCEGGGGEHAGADVRHLELIAIDDASLDATWEVLQSLGDERLRLLRHDANLGAHATLNEALKWRRTSSSPLSTWTIYSFLTALRPISRSSN